VSFDVDIQFQISAHLPLLKKNSANLGQFTASSIRISFVTLVYPALIFAYLGQGARLIADGANVISNPFYLTIPGGENSPLWWATWVMGIFATVSSSAFSGIDLGTLKK
jgi:K+ transporter